VEPADSKEAPRPASAKPAVASLLPLAASLQFAANVEVLRAGCAMVGRLVLGLSSSGHQKSTSGGLQGETSTCSHRPRGLFLELRGDDR